MNTDSLAAAVHERAVGYVLRTFVPQRSVPMVWFILILLGVGLIFGALARLIVPGRDDLSLGQTWLLGVVGSLVGGFLGYAIFGADIDDGAVQAGGIISSIIGSVIVLLIYRVVRGRNAAR